jgi:hypothetical protein
MVGPSHPGNGQCIDQAITEPISEEAEACVSQATYMGLKRVLGHFDRIQYLIHYPYCCAELIPHRA